MGSSQDLSTRLSTLKIPFADATIYIGSRRLNKYTQTLKLGFAAAPLLRRRWKMASSSNSPCAACKFLRRKCQTECVFAPYFPPDQPQKFSNVHKVFGASNVTKLLNELHPSQREDAVNSLAYEADMRLRDPVYGCVGVISLLQHQLRQLQIDLSCAKSELSKYQNLGITGHAGSLIAAAAAAATATATTHHHHHPQNLGINLIGAGGGSRDHHYHHQFFPRISNR
ncbi:protein ASYMMETRIC LEAVES 2-like isoform X1 [Populus alba x Populus x berolinensis]|nr:protein ASYMMETRIC LEAVES 2-like isoform X1 [Populus alba x Populus x berolinensis]